jgi:hypothetical protein
MLTIRDLRIEIEAVEQAIAASFFVAEVVALEAVLVGLQTELRKLEQ